MTNQTQKPKTRFRGAITRILLVLVSLVIALIIGESAARLFLTVPKINRIRPHDDQTAYRYASNPLLGYVLKESYRNDNPNHSETFAYINSHGQRDIERQVAKPPGTYRVIVLGDSVVAGHDIASLHDTISRQLEQQYEQLKKPVEVLNFGIGGYCTRAEVELLRTRAIQFKPDMVVLVWVSNDTTNFNDMLIQGKYRRTRPIAINQLFIHSHLMRYTCLAYDLFNFRQETDANYDRRRNLQSKGLVSNVTVGFKQIKDLADQHNFGVLVVVWPEFSSTLPMDLESSAFDKLPNGELWVTRHAIAANLPVRSLVRYFRDDMAAHNQKDDANNFYTVGDTMHPNPQGAKVAAKAIRRLLGNPKSWSSKWTPRIK